MSKRGIRTFVEADREGVIKLWNDCQLTRPWNDPNKDIDRKLADSPEWFFVVSTSATTQHDREIIGSLMVGYDGHRGWVNYLAVAPDFQRTGLGQQFMTHAEQLLTSVGCPKLNLQVRTSNQDAIAFYESLDYTRDDCVSLGKRLIAD